MNKRSALQSSSKELEVNEPQSGWVARLQLKHTIVFNGF